MNFIHFMHWDSKRSSNLPEAPLPGRDSNTNRLICFFHSRSTLMECFTWYLLYFLQENVLGSLKKKKKQRERERQKMPMDGCIIKEWPRASLPLYRFSLGSLLCQKFITLRTCLFGCIPYRIHTHTHTHTHTQTHVCMHVCCKKWPTWISISWRCRHKIT